MVFGADGGVCPVLRRLARFGLGGKMGSGKQFVSWIHEDDFCRAVEWLIEREDLNGPVNFAAPNPLTNAEMMRILRRVCRAPFGLPATEWMLEVGAFFLRTETELIIKSRRVIPSKLLASGFEFHFPQLENALRDLEHQRTG
jgi:NAD dependent epimerase/dehydratase family enzyme